MAWLAFCRIILLCGDGSAADGDVLKYHRVPLGDDPSIAAPKPDALADAVPVDG